MFDEWMGGEKSDGSENDLEDVDIDDAFAVNKFSRAGKKSHLLLQL